MTRKKIRRDDLRASLKAAARGDQTVVVPLLAAPYASHPDYREEWTVGAAV